MISVIPQSATLPKSGATTRLGRAIETLARSCASLGRAVAHRRDVNLMLDLDDRMLKDIGLVRNDVVGVLAQPLHRDPSVLLRLRTVERRAARRIPAPRLSRTACDA